MPGSQLINQAPSLINFNGGRFRDPLAPAMQSRAFSSQSINPKAHTSISATIQGDFGGITFSNYIAFFHLQGISPTGSRVFWGVSIVMGGGNIQLNVGVGLDIPALTTPSNNFERFFTHFGSGTSAYLPLPIKLTINEGIMSCFVRNSNTPFYTSNPSFTDVSEVFLVAATPSNLIYFTDCIIQRHP